MLAPMAAGHEILTVEALAADGKLAEVQQAMAAGGGSQCGYCTPGFVMSLFAEQYRPGRIGPLRSARIGRQSVPLHRLSAHPRRGAVAWVAAPAGAFLDRLSRPAPRLEAIEYESLRRAILASH